MKVGIIGYGTEGKASYDYWRKRGADITIFDANPALAAPEGARTVLGPEYLAELDGYDLLVRSPGVNPAHIKTSSPVTSATREFFAQCPAPIIGVTGTKGKGTTSTLIAEILKAVGKTVWLGGNIGRAGLEFLDEVTPTDVVVLELSSYQLVDLDRSPHIGVCLMIVPEHVLWHGSMDKYAAAKAAIARYQMVGDVLVYHAHNQFSRQIAQMSVAKRIPYLEAPGAYIQDNGVMMSGRQIIPTQEVGLIGPHNLENICAAVTATRDYTNGHEPKLCDVLRSFKGLPNRLEVIRKVRGVVWVNDTFSVNPSATAAAVASFDQPKVLILGGFDRGLDFDGLADAVSGSLIRGVVVMGETGPKIASLLRDRGVLPIVDGGSTMPEIVAAAADLAKSGDVVLLSPGCASFGLFKDYQDRGRQFVAAVQALALGD